MQFCFYPILENSCGNVRHCPHLGGVPIAALVQIANDSGQTVQQLQLQLDAERERSHKLVGENQMTAEDMFNNLETARLIVAELDRSFVLSQLGFAMGLVSPIAKSRK